MAETTVLEAPVRKGPIFERAGVRAVRLGVRAGASVPTHDSNADVIAVVVRGSGTFTVNGEPRSIAPGDVIDMAPKTPHSIEAREDLELVVLHCRLGGGVEPITCGAH
ncbi:MAG TPA: cupin domain-containing protein [Terriglobales bacterium]|nr:cupin domain-containing protein [Terriglobales bacterium]